MEGSAIDINDIVGVEQWNRGRSFVEMPMEIY